MKLSRVGSSDLEIELLRNGARNKKNHLTKQFIVAIKIGKFSNQGNSHRERDSFVTLCKSASFSGNNQKQLCKNL